jgi:RNA 2',3'-cyclic 3'-phosphodiesterase
MRLFFGIFPPDSVIHEAVAIRDRVPPPRNAKWVAPEKMHVTLRFLGEQESLDPWIELGTRIAQLHSPFTIALGGVGDFGHVLWIGVLDAEPLINLATDLGAVDYHPHLTIARARRAHASDVEGRTSSFRVASFDLIESIGGRYESRRSFALQSEAASVPASPDGSLPQK